MAVGDFSTTLEMTEGKRFEDVRRQMVRLQTSDIRLAVWLVVYTPLTAGGMVAGVFSTTLEMTGMERGLRNEI